jgi:hypothetical protein
LLLAATDIAHCTRSNPHLKEQQYFAAAAHANSSSFGQANWLEGNFEQLAIPPSMQQQQQQQPSSSSSSSSSRTINYVSRS